jgi:hypothetical protein
MSRWKIFQFLCGQLRGGLLGTTPPAPPRSMAWELLIEAASHHHITPALAFYSARNSSFPPEVRDYLDAALLLNAQRNVRILDTLGRVATALNAIDIEPVLLKGAAHVVDAMYPAAGFRVLGDLDVLIPEQRAVDALAALHGIGFRSGGPPLPENHHHLPMLCDPETEAGVELHIAVVHRRSEAIAPVAWFVDATRVVAFNGARVRLPGATQLAAHVVVHDQLDHEGYLHGRLSLRHLLDLALILARHEGAIDWAELDRCFGEAGKGAVLATYLYYMETLLGQVAPRIGHAPRRSPLGRLRRGIEPGLARPLVVAAKLSIGFLAARRADPLAVLDLLQPGKWLKRIRLLARACAPRW